MVDCSLEWNAGYSEEVLAFTNNINQKDGGGGEERENQSMAMVLMRTKRGVRKQIQPQFA